MGERQWGMKERERRKSKIEKEGRESGTEYERESEIK